MNDRAMFLPVLAMVAITLLAWLRLYQLRFAEMRRRHIDPQSIALSAQKDAGLADTRAADNFNNQFQLPVLFYAAVLVAHATSLGSDLFVQLSWAFVASRLVHALIQCTYNRVTHRFDMKFAASTHARAHPCARRCEFRKRCNSINHRQRPCRRYNLNAPRQHRKPQFLEQ